VRERSLRPEDMMCPSLTPTWELEEKREASPGTIMDSSKSTTMAVSKPVSQVRLLSSRCTEDVQKEIDRLGKTCSWTRFSNGLVLVMMETPVYARQFFSAQMSEKELGLMLTTAGFIRRLH